MYDAIAPCMQGKTASTPRKIFSAFHLDLTMASLMTIVRFFRRAKAPNEDSGLDCHNALPAIACAPFALLDAEKLPVNAWVYIRKTISGETFGAPGPTRTGTSLRTTDFESVASTNSATGAWRAFDAASRALQYSYRRTPVNA